MLPSVCKASTTTAHVHAGSAGIVSAPVDLLSEEEQMMKETGNKGSLLSLRRTVY